MRLLGFLFVLLAVVISHADIPCDDDVLMRFQARANCLEKNNSRSCSSLPILAAMGGGASTLMLKARRNPEFKKLERYVEQVRETSNRLVKDYKAVLESYYKIKKKMDPNASEPPLHEFDFKEFEKYKGLIKQENPNNLFIQELEKYGRGKAVDISQRVMSYAAEQMEAPKVTTPEMLKFTNSFPNIIRSINSRFRVAMNEIAAAHGFPLDGNKQYGDERANGKVREAHLERNDQMQKDLEAEAQRLEATQPEPKIGGPQSGRATISAMGATAVTAAGIAGGFMLSTADTNSKRAAITNCSNSFGLKFSEEETFQFAKAIDLQNGLSGKGKLDCKDIVFTENGLKDILKDGKASPNQKQMMCRMEAQLAERDKKLDESVDWDNENCQNKMTPMQGRIYASYSEDTATITTSDGTKVEVKWDGIGEWNYSSMKSLSDSSFEQYLRDKVKSPFSSHSANSENINPRVMCDGREGGIYPTRMCDVSKAMRTLSQVRNMGNILCPSRAAGSSNIFDSSRSNQR
jgi:hypothetical protein